jgi:Rhodopirellula transposase DDE domain
MAARRAARPGEQPRLPQDSAGQAVPYGVYDVTGDTGWVSAGTDHDTAAFAVESVRRWWKAAGRDEYPAARRLLVTADAGGSNGYRTRAWKAELAALAAGTGLEITVCHFPPGTSKWNKVEHRLFSHITMNWRGRPLTSHEVIVQTIAATTTRTGLRVRAELDDSTYDTGVKISDRQMDALPLTRHNWHGDWNYTLRPEAYDQDAGTPGPFDQPSPDLAWLCHPALTGLPAAEWDALTAALMTLHGQQREASLDKRRGHRPRLTAPGEPAAVPSSPWPTGSWPPSCITAWRCPRWPSPPCSACGPRRSTSASATSASSWTRPDESSSPAPDGSRTLMTPTSWQDRQASLFSPRSRQRVNNLQALS